MSRFNTPFAVILIAVVVAAFVPQGPGNAATHIAETYDVPAFLLEAVDCQVAPLALGAAFSGKKPTSMLPCDEQVIGRVIEIIDEDCDGAGYGRITCNDDGTVESLHVTCLPS